MRARIIAIVALLAIGCTPPDEEFGAEASTLTAAQRRMRATIIRDTARARGITDGALMIALLAEEETYLSHCASEFPACPGPASSDCGGRAVISGGGDGPCSANQGGLGMFQIDDGTESNTVRVHGDRVLTLVGNTEVAIDRVLDKLVRSHYVGISTRAEAITFLNALRIDDRNWDPYIRTLVRYWNGCPESGSCWSNRYPKYDRAGRTLLREMGSEFWYGTPAPMSATGWLASPIDPPRVTSYVTRQAADGRWQTHDCTPATRRNHRGTDFGVPIGTPVRAGAAGTILRSTTGCGNDGSMSSTCGGGFGNHVIVLHAGGMATLYAHLSPDGTQVRSGSVECGQVLGHSGNSGRSTGPHLHFEVRSGVTDVTSYFRSNNTLDPYGGACSTQPEALWIGGAPMASCMPTTQRDDAVVVGSTYPREVRGTPGAQIRQIIQWRNRGTTTWTPDNYLMRHQSGAFSEVAEVELPAGTMVRPGQQISLRITVTVPSTPGLHRGIWRMSRRDGTAFGTDAYLMVRVPAAPRECSSQTLGRNVPSGSCVQVTYPACGMSECAWFRCSDGSWLCTERSECAGDAFDHAECAPPMPDGGVDGGSCTGGGTAQVGEMCTMDTECCDGLTCGADDNGARACCKAPGEACGSSGECCGTVFCEMGFCACVPENQLCWNDSDCCDGLGCIAGACRNITGCTREALSCASETECCWPLRCQVAPEGGSQCCTGAGNHCEADADCCGDMSCTAGYCVCRAAGESCSNLLDCCGALLCNSGTCG